MELELIRGLLGAPELYYEVYPKTTGATESGGKIRHRLRAAWEAHNYPSENIHFEHSPPTSTTHSVSITHSPGGTGFAWIRHPSRVGIDMEKLSRISIPVIQRVSEPAEIGQAPNPLFIWSAKEAAFKSYWGTRNQPSLISEVIVSDWSKKTTLGFSFNFSIGGQAKGRGFFLYQNETSMALAVFTP